MVETARATDGTTNLIVVSGDSHVGPRLVEDLRPYCPKKYLEEFDRFTVENKDTFDAPGGELYHEAEGTTRGSRATQLQSRHSLLNRKTAGHYDIHTRLREMDWDGVAAEVIFHGSQNTEVFPFFGAREWARPDTERNLELVAVGYHLYNQWLADFVSVQPERHIGLLYAPMWDVDLAVKEVEWAAGAGLHGVNLPAPRGGIAEYDDPVWEPFWSACESLGLSLATHAGVPMNPVFGPQAHLITVYETAGYQSRRGMHRLIFGGVFERHPSLHLILTEQMRGWWRPTMRDLDTLCSSPSEELRNQIPRMPSDYMRKNVFIGASFMPPAEVQEAIMEGFASNVVWGRDYPHGEGTYKYPEHEDEESTTRRYMHWAFAGCPLEETKGMLGENGVRAYHLDREALAAVAARIGPTPDEIIKPLMEIPEDWQNSVADIFTGALARE